MGTRSLIKIDGVTYAKIYKHWDGNPEHMLPWLKLFNEEFTAERGDDPPYKFAQLLRRTGDPKFTLFYGLDDSQTTGWGVVPGGDIRMGQEYEYTLHSDGTVTWRET